MGLVLFTITEECHMNRLRESGRQSFVVSLTHTCFTFLLVFGGLKYILHLETFVAMVLAAVASSSSPGLCSGKYEPSTG